VNLRGGASCLRQAVGGARPTGAPAPEQASLRVLRKAKQSARAAHLICSFTAASRRGEYSTLATFLGGLGGEEARGPLDQTNQQTGGRGPHKCPPRVQPTLVATSPRPSRAST
jgi:hypothetical protein